MINWAEIYQVLSPIHNWRDLSKKWQDSFSYTFARQCFNYSIPELSAYTNRLLGGDTRGRYATYLAALTGTFNQLQTAEVTDVLDLVQQVDTQALFEGFIAQTGLNPADVAGVLKYLVYWFIPTRKPLGAMAKDDPRLTKAMQQLRQVKISYNLDLLEAGTTPEARRVLAETTGAELRDIEELVNRADFSRLPWASTATISNIIGAGYPSIERLAAADLEQVREDFYRYGESIGKNLKLGNEIDNSHRIARIVPRIVIN